jgi:hypothetical protein
MVRVVAFTALVACACSTGTSPESGVPPDAGSNGFDATVSTPDSAPPEDAGVRRTSEPSIEYTARLVLIEDGSDVDCVVFARAGNIVFRAVHRESGKVLVAGSACINPSTTGPLDPGTYDVTFTLHNRMMEPISTVSGTYVIGERSGVDVELVFPIQSFKVSWTIGRDTPGGRTTLTCQQAGAKFVDFAPVVDGDLLQGHYSIECDRGSLITGAVPLGHYTYEVKLLDDHSQALATSGPREMNVTVEKRATIPVDFTVP